MSEMTDDTQSATAPSSRPLMKRVTAPARPVWETAFRDPVTDGHLRLAGLSWSERQAARIGLATLGMLLLSVLFAEVWRRGELLPLGDGDRLTFLPQGLLAVTLFTFTIAWTMLVWGALTSGWPVKLVIAALFLITNASLSIPAAISVGDRAAYDVGPHLITAGYFGTAGLLVAAIALPLLPARVSALVLPTLRLLVTVGISVFFLTHLWIHVVSLEEGVPGGVQFFVSAAVAEIDGLLVPLVYVSAVLVIDFSVDVSLGVARTIHDTPRRLLRWLLVALLAVKLWFILFDELGDWSTYVQDRPAAVLRTVVSVTLLAVVVRLVTRFPLTGAHDSAKEWLLYGVSVGFATTSVIVILITGFGIFLGVQFYDAEMPGFIESFPYDVLIDWTLPILAGLAALVGVWLWRKRTPMAMEVGSGLIIIGAWGLPGLLLNASSLEAGFSDKLVDLMVTLALVVVLARCWKRIDTRLTVLIAAVAVFTWLAMTQGDWINLVGALFGLPVILVVVVGIVFSILGDAGFTATSGKLLPQGARVLIFVGYLVLSVGLLHWVATTHAVSLGDAQSAGGFHFIGIPLGAWLIGRRLLRLDDEVAPAAEPAPVS